MKKATQKEIGSWLNLSVRRVRELQKEGAIPRGAGIMAAVHGYLDYLRGLARSGVDESDGAIFARERARAERERADNLALKNQILRRELADVAVIAEIIAKLGSQIGAKLDSLPGELRRKLPNLTATELEIVRRTVVKCQNDIAALPSVTDEILNDRIDARD